MKKSGLLVSKLGKFCCFGRKWQLPFSKGSHVKHTCKGLRITKKVVRPLQSGKFGVKCNELSLLPLGLLLGAMILEFWKIIEKEASSHSAQTCALKSCRQPSSGTAHTVRTSASFCQCRLSTWALLSLLLPSLLTD